VIRRGHDGREPIRARGQPPFDGGGEHAIDGLVVDALEERERVRVRRRRLVKCGDALDDDVGVANDKSLGRQLLGGSKVVRLGINEITRLKFAHGQCDIKRRVLVKNAVVLGENKLGRRHVGRGGDEADRRGIARPGLDLLPVRDGNSLGGQAEVDEVVRRSERGDLAGRWLVLAVVGKTLRDHAWVKREGGLRVSVAGGTSGNLGLLALTVACGLRRRGTGTGTRIGTRIGNRVLASTGCTWVSWSRAGCGVGCSTGGCDASVDISLSGARDTRSWAVDQRKSSANCARGACSGNEFSADALGELCAGASGLAVLTRITFLKTLEFFIQGDGILSILKRKGGTAMRTGKGSERKGESDEASVLHDVADYKGVMGRDRLTTPGHRMLKSVEENA
jgi:hypothetical protein